jgi:cytidine deaminase
MKKFSSTDIDDEIIEQLILKSSEVRMLAYCPYSQFKVGAALLTDNGEIFTGCNVENISYGLTVCAERSAIFSMVGKGRKNIKAIAVSTENGLFLIKQGTSPW